MDIHEWDLLYAVSLNKVNEHFQKNNSHLISTFDYRTTDPNFGISIHTKGNFTSWEIASIASEDSHERLKLNIEVTNLLVAGLTSDVLQSSQLNVSYQVELKFIPEKLNTNKHNLVFDYNGNEDGGGEDNIGIINVTDASGNLGEDNAKIVAQYILECIQSNEDKLNYVFASVLLNNEKENWLSPKFVSFRLATLADGRSFMCLFGSMSERSNNSYNIDPDLFRQDNNMYLMISSNIFLERIVLPGLSNTMPKGFLWFDTSEIINNGGWMLPSIKKSGTHYHPEVKSLAIKVASDKLKTNASGACDLKLKIHLSFTYESNDTIKLNTTTRAIEFIPDPNPSFSKHVSKPWYLKLPSFYEFIVHYIVNEVTNSIGNHLKNHLKENAGLNLNVKNLQLTWTNVDFESISSGGLSDNFYLRGVAN